MLKVRVVFGIVFLYACLMFLVSLPLFSQKVSLLLLLVLFGSLFGFFLFKNANGGAVLIGFSIAGGFNALWFNTNILNSLSMFSSLDSLAPLRAFMLLGAVWIVSVFALKLLGRRGKKVAVSEFTQEELDGVKFNGMDDFFRHSANAAYGVRNGETKEELLKNAKASSMIRRK